MISNVFIEEAIAFHEAAHAVVALTIPLEIVKISIVAETDSDGSYDGGCEVDLESFFSKT
ncbi:hypothetical protein [Geomesophilobacter sediminis]|uniref:Peptidase M41 domain-containing protein n=1 Tax=Geomesophilobacter sediminis TaxID=2798584 RepID=A0A8J7M1X6_9BACT|nr:hypothetical protein [Geomesophilobacter sediminis]MBJ6727189.1 hypothetical protein [Geomesophilobacter sediminis]